ncbi:MAG: chromate transporter [Clostridia bacterium]|nr:chromate transporter [Clostridia bacterium]
MKKTKIILDLFLTMLKIGLFTFGGGYAMIALLENEFVSKKKWLEKEEFLDIIAIAESTPGPIAINSSTYIGYKLAGVLGSAFATVAVCIPSFVIIYTISLFFDKFLTLTYVEYAFRGIQACVVYLIISAGIKMGKGLKKNAFNIIVFSATIVCMLLFSIFAVKFSAVFYILISGTLGLLVYLIGKLTKKEETK